MELVEAIRLHRQGSGRWIDRGLAPEHLRLLIEAAARSPSHFNSQPWRFVAVLGADQRAAIARLAGATEAPPALLAIVLNRSEYKPGELQGLYSTITLGAVVQTLSLVAISQQIGLRPIELPEGDAGQAIAAALAIPDDQALVLLFGLGYLRDEPATERAGLPAPLPLSAVTSLNTWGAPVPDSLIGTESASLLWPPHR